MYRRTSGRFHPGATERYPRRVLGGVRCRASIAALLVIAVAAACTEATDDPDPSAQGSPSAEATLQVPSPSPSGRVRVTVDPVAEDLEQPAAFTFLPDGRILYAERVRGAIRLLDPISGADDRFFVVRDLVGEVTNSAGVLGLAVHPDYPDRPLVYAFVTRSVAGEERSQVVRIVVRNHRGRSMKPIYDPGIPVTQRHNGGRIYFGPDGFLYVVIGEHDLFAPAQDLESPIGKIHRMTDSGKPAPGNPFPRTTVFAYGVRNSFGLDADPQTGDLWYTDNGPECNDEINRLVAGGNYGWGPSADCSSAPGSVRSTNRDGADVIRPAWLIDRTIGISGLVFCSGCELGPRSEGALFYGDFNLFAIHRLTLSEDRRHVVREQIVYTHPRHVLSLEAGPDGAMYLSDPQGIYQLVPR